MNQTFEKAREFMYRNARPLDLARFRYHFENGSKEDVVRVLSYYQNADGGCGHAVEADCWNPNSIPLHTNGVCEILREIGWEDDEHPLVKGIVKWLGSGACFDGKTWAVTVESNNDYPHAPWWHTESVSSCHTDYNGTVQLAGFLVRYAKRDSAEFELGLRVVREAIAALSPDELMDMHTCTCYIRMLEFVEQANAADLIEYDLLKEKLRASVNKLIERDTSKWVWYVCQPSQFMNSKKSEYYPENRAIADYECEHIIRTQLEDGSWPIRWAWEKYPEEWAIAKNWWKGTGVILNLLYLKGMEQL